MLDRIKSSDPIDFARELGVMATHALDSVRQELAALCSKTPAMVTSSSILPKASQ